MKLCRKTETYQCFEYRGTAESWGKMKKYFWWRKWACHDRDARQIMLQNGTIMPLAKGDWIITDGVDVIDVMPATAFGWGFEIVGESMLSE